MGDAPDASRHERRRRRRQRPEDSIGISSRRVASMAAILAATTSPRPLAARSCGDSPQYVSPLGLACSQHASLDIGCEAFGSVGLHEDEVNDLLRNCPHACGISVGDDDCDHLIEEAGDEHASPRILQSDPAGTCYDGCMDDPSFQTKYFLSCENHQRLDCESFVEVGFSEQEVFDLVVSCPCSCRIPCGTYTEAPSASPSSVPTGDFYRCDNPRCQDDPTYRSKLSLTCDSHARFDCTNMGAIGYSEEEVSELIRRCPCSCKSWCPDLFISDAPTPRPSISASSARPTMTFSSSPSSRPSIGASSSPSFQPSVGMMSSNPSSEPSVGRGWSPSPRPSSVAVDTSSGSPKAEHAMKSSSEVVASISDVVSQWDQRTTSHPTESPVTQDPTPILPMSYIDVPSTAKPSPRPISRSPTATPTTERPTITPAKVKEELQEYAEVNIIGRIEEYPGSDSSVGAIPGDTDNPSKALPVLATLFTLTIIGGALFVLSKKYPEHLSTVGGRLQGTMERARMILRVARGDDLADIVLKANAEDRDNDLARSDSFGSAKSNVTFAKDLVTVYEIPSSIPVRRSVSFADSFGEELAVELGPEPDAYFDEEITIGLESRPEAAAYFDEEVVMESGVEPTVSLDEEVTTEPRPEPAVRLDETLTTELAREPAVRLSVEVPAELEPAPVESLAKKVSRKLVPAPGPTVVTPHSLEKKVAKKLKKQGSRPTYNLDEKVTTELGLGTVTSLDDIDDYLDSSSSRSSTDGDVDTESSGSLSMGPGSYDSAEISVESNPGPLTLRAYVGKREISIPLPGIFDPGSRGGQSHSWDDSI